VTFQQAYLSVNGGKQRIDVWFNPTTLNVKSTARWGPAAAMTGDELTYLGGEEQALSLTFLFHADGARTGEQVQSKLDQLRNLLRPVDQVVDKVARKRPPTVEFVWGSWTSQPSVVTAVDVTTELFDGEGLPLRAWVALTLSRSLTSPEETAKKKKNNPTTMATQRRRGHEVVPGEDLALIAEHHYRTPTRWREIAEMNELDDPLRLEAPTLLIVPMEQPR
jgi:hypothetical protein